MGHASRVSNRGLGLGAFGLAWLLSGPQQSVDWQELPDAKGRVPFPAGFESPPEAPPAEPAGSPGCGRETLVPNVYLHSGEFHLSAVDLRIPGRGPDFVWARKYRSRHGPNSAQGNGWDFSYDVWIEQVGPAVRLHDGNTRRDLYLPRPDGTYTARQHFREGQFNLDGTFTLTFADAGTWNFHALDASAAAGKLESVIDRNSNALVFQYDGLGRLVQVTDTLNRSIAIGYTTGGFIQSVTDFSGRSVSYAYYGPSEPGGSPGDLKSVTTPPVPGFPSGKTTVYTYSTGFADARLNHNLLTITDPKGQAWLVNTYSPETQPKALLFDRLVRQRRGNPGEDIKIETELVPLSLVSVEPLKVIVNDRVGNVMECLFDRRGHLIEKRQYTGRANPSQPTTSTQNRPVNPLRGDDPASFVTRYSYNVDSLVERIVHPNGNETEKVYELALDPAAPWRQRGNLRELRRTPGTHVPAGDQAELVELFEYETGLGGCCGVSFIKRHVDARGNETIHTYDSQGNRLHTQHRIPSVVEDWEYNSFGQVTAHILPDNGSSHRRRDEYRYYGPGDGAQNGYLKEIVLDAPNFAVTTGYVYDSVGHVVSKTDPNNHVTEYTVNALDQVISERSPIIAGAQIERLFTYDANDNLEQLDVENRNENGVQQANTHFTTSWTFGILNEVTSETREVDPGTIAVEYAYDANRNRTLVRKGEATAGGSQPANTVTTLHDERDLVWRVTRADGDPGESTDQHDYDGNGNRRAEHEGLEDGAHTTTYAYDGFDRRVSTSDPMGNLTEYHYDPNGNEGGRSGNDSSPLHPFGKKVTGQLLDSSGTPGSTRLYEHTYVYDALDRVIQHDVRHFDTETQGSIGDGQSTTTMSWTANSQVENQTRDGAAPGTSFDYDTANRLQLATDAKLNTTQYGYDAVGNVIQIVETERPDLGGASQVFTHTFAYDALDRLQTLTDGLGSVWTYRYDSRGNRVLETDSLGHDTRYTYDGLDRLVRGARDLNDNGLFTEPIDVILLHTWDRSSRRTSDTDDRGNTMRYAYDALDRLIVTQMADGTIEQNGTGATWTLGQPSPNLSGFTSGWDAHDSLEVRRDAVGSTVTSVYDALDRVVSRAIVRGPSVLGTTSETYQYDGLSRLVSAQDNDTVVSRGSASTSGYDSLDDVLRETQRILPAGPVRTVTATYDARGNQTGLVYPGGRSIARFYDVLDRPTLVREDPAGPGTTIASYAYVGPERLERRDYGNGTRLLPTYNGINDTNPPGDFGVRHLARTLHRRIIGGAVLDDRSNLWDRAGNKSQSTTPSPAVTWSYSYDALDRLMTSNVTPGGPSITYGLDGAGNRTSVVGGPDPGGYVANVVNAYTSTPFDTRTYDTNGNLFSQTSPTRTYRYDYRDQLVQYTDAGTGLTTSYRYDCLGRRIEKNVGGMISRHYHDGAEEIEEQSSLNATVATWVHSKGPHSLLQMIRGVQKYYYHEDDLGSVRKVSDASGTVVESIEYDDFGKPTVSSSGPPVIQTQAPNQAAAQESDLDGGSGSFSLVLAENFTLPQSGDLTLVRWWGTYDQSMPPATDDFTIEIRTDSGGFPDALVPPQSHPGNAVSRTVTGQLISGFYTEYSYQATIAPIALTAGTSYWLLIYGNTVGYSGTWRWEHSSAGNGQAASNFNNSGWSIAFVDFCYEIEVTTGPPPSGNPFLYRGLRWDPETKTSLIETELLSLSLVSVNLLVPANEEPRAGRFESRDQPPLVALGNSYTFADNNPLRSWDDVVKEPAIEEGRSSWVLGRRPSGVLGGPGAGVPGTGRVLEGPPDLPRIGAPQEECDGPCLGVSDSIKRQIFTVPCEAFGPELRRAGALSMVTDIRQLPQAQRAKMENDAKKMANAQCQARGGDDCLCVGDLFLNMTSKTIGGKCVAIAFFSYKGECTDSF